MPDNSNQKYNRPYFIKNKEPPSREDKLFHTKMIIDTINIFFDHKHERIKQEDKMDERMFSSYQKYLDETFRILNDPKSSESDRKEAQQRYLLMLKEIRGIRSNLNHREKTQLIKWGIAVGGITLTAIARIICHTK